MSLSVEAGELPELAAAVEVAAYRVVVEAVTNAVRHGHGERCWVRMDVGEHGRLRVQVENDGVSADGWVPGVGLMGMRERAEELGGTMSVEPRDGGGARVVVEFPLGSPCSWLTPTPSSARVWAP